MPQRTAEPTDRWEIGSDFHWDPGPTGDGWCPPGPSVAFASGTGALRALLGLLGGRRLHLPTYFCQDVVDALARDVPVARYTELPDGRGPDPGTVRARPGDVVLRANLFGRGREVPRADWLPPGTVLVEDHTHDPLSPWARHGGADYAMASLRKSLPLPDGAVLWSPTGRGLPRVPSRPEPAARDKLRAMRLKAAWLAGADVDKDAFRALQLRAEAVICRDVTAMSGVSARLLGRLGVAAARDRRIRNADRLTGALACVTGIAVLPPPPPGGAPFGVQLVLPGRSERDRLRTHLREQRIYTAVHWPVPGSGPAADTAARLVTVPVDQRYTDHDVDRVAAAVRAAQENSFSCSARSSSISRPGGSVTSS